MKKVLGFGVKNHRIYLLKDDFSLMEMSRRLEDPVPVFEDPALSQLVFKDLPARYFRIFAFKRDFLGKDLILFLSDRGALASNRSPYRHLEGGVRGVEYAPLSEDEKILYWTGQKIGVIDFMKTGEPLFAALPPAARSERMAERKELYEEGIDIRQALWVRENTHVVFLDVNEIWLLEAEPPRPFLARPLGEVLPGSRLIYQSRKDLLYFLDPSGKLTRLRIGES